MKFAITKLFYKQNQKNRKSKIEIGKLAEKEVQKYLIGKGYKILQTNYRNSIGEIDIIFNKGNNIIFGEVRSSTNKEFMDAEDSITKRKIRKIINVAEAYLKNNNFKNMIFRFDVFAVNIEDNGNLKEINHIESAFTCDI